ncbi:MAG TPA: cyclase family protein [Terriglobales bacterium]|nr:cyclase family protein [Terriglobales bacterium]
MKFKTLVIGYALALALLLFAQRRPGVVQPSSFTGVVDLTHSYIRTQAKGPFVDLGLARNASLTQKDAPHRVTVSAQANTHIDAPAHLQQGMWTVDQIPPERLIAPLCVLDVTLQVRRNSDYELSVEDIAQWEQIHGEIPPGAVVLARTGWGERWNSPLAYRNSDKNGIMHYPGYSQAAARFLVEGRMVLALGIDTLSVDPGSARVSAVHQYTLAHSVYHLENVANLERVPDAGAVVVVAPMKLEGEVDGPVRILALTRR